MVKGIKAYDPKVRRKMRRKNHIARDLGSTKYHQRVREGRKPLPPEPDVDDWKDFI